MKISYNQHKWDNEGTHYTQRIRMDESDFEQINDAVRTEIELNYPGGREYSEDNITSRLFLRPLFIENGGVSFLTNTQTKFISLFITDKRLKFNLNSYIKINSK
jgi:hypothetical protein